MNLDGKCGIAGIDDDGDAQIDEWLLWNQDDDEDGVIDEDPIDGVDNDGDGNIDEDCGIDTNNDGAPGIVGMDDDGDGVVDEGSIWDDDEDGQYGRDVLNEVIYAFDNGTNTLAESFPQTGESVVLSNHVTSFEAKYISPTQIRILLRLTGDDGESVTFTEHVCPRNTLQKTGKRVR